MSQLVPWLLVGLAACGGTQADRPDPGDPCSVATSMRDDALRGLASAPGCETDDDCVVMSSEIECANVRLGDCGTVVHRSVLSSLDWGAVEREICRAVEGSDYGCTVSASCALLGAPRCERGACKQTPAADPLAEDP